MKAVKNKNFEEEKMKRKRMKKAAAVLLSAAMAFSVPMVSGPAETSASVQAPKYVKLNTSFKTLKVGQTHYRLYLTNNKASWKIKKVAVSDKTIAAAYGKTTDSVRLKAKKEGRTTVTLSLKTAKRKKHAVKTLKCRVNVVPAAASVPELPDQPAEPVTPAAIKEMTVSSQAELDTALANTSLESLSIQTNDAVNLTIPSGNYSNVTLNVNAPNAEITNRAVFRAITIRAIGENTWIEDAIGNNLQIESVKARIVVNDGAKVETINFTSADADIKLEVNGAISNVAVSATIKIEISGNTIRIPVTIGANAGSTELTANVPVDIMTEADANLILNKGAEGSTVKAVTRSVTVKLKNSTNESVVVEKADGTKQTVSNSGTTTTVTSAASSSTAPGTYYPSGSYYPSSGSTGSSSSENTVKHTLPTFTIKASVRTDSVTMGALLIDKKDIHINGCVNPVIKKVQRSGNRGANKYDITENENGVLIFETNSLGTNYLEETIERGVGNWIYLTVEDQGTEYLGLVVMKFGDIIQAGNVKIFEGGMTKKTDKTVSFDAEIISGSAIAAAPDKGWIRLTIPYDSVKYQGGSNLKIVSGTNFDTETWMNFQLIAEDNEQRWMSEKNGRVTYEELIKQVQRGVSQNENFLYMTLKFTDNGKTYTGNVATTYRDFFGDDPDHFAEGRHSYTAVLYETES